MEAKLRKHCKRKHFKTGPAAVNVLNRTIFTVSRADLSEANQRDILLPAFLALDDLRAGKLSPGHFVTLNESNCMTWQLGRQLAIHRVSAETGDLALVVKQRTEIAADALAEIGERFRTRGSFTPTGDELESIRLSLDLCRQLLATMPAGSVFKAMDDADEMVNETFLDAEKVGLAPRGTEINR